VKKAAWLLFFLPALVRADDVYLQGGGVLSGRIVEQTETMVTVNIGDGLIGVPPSRVERIVRGRSDLDDYDQRASRLDPEDLKGWRSLGRWAAEQGLSKQSRGAYEKALALAPDDPEARQALGFVRIDGQWLTEEESYQARGYVKYEGEWMTPAEAQRAQASDAADQARRNAELRAIDAEIKASEAQARAQEAEERAKEAEKTRRSDYPMYWGGWGYGANYWPSGIVAGSYRPVSRPYGKAK